MNPIAQGHSGSRPRARTNRRGAQRVRDGLALVDFLIAIAIVGIAVSIMLPSLGPSEPIRIVGAANVLVSDVEFAQSASLADPANPLVVRFDADTDTYWLALFSDQETPINRANGQPYLVAYDDASDFVGVQLALEGGGDRIIFDSFGRLQAAADTVVELTNSTGTLYIVVSCDTGSVRIEFDDPTPPKVEEKSEGGQLAME